MAFCSHNCLHLETKSFRVLSFPRTTFQKQVTSPRSGKGMRTEGPLSGSLMKRKLLLTTLDLSFKLFINTGSSCLCRDSYLRRDLWLQMVKMALLETPKLDYSKDEFSLFEGFQLYFCNLMMYVCMDGWMEGRKSQPTFQCISALCSAYPSCWPIYLKDSELHLDSDPLVLGTGFSRVLLAPCVGMLYVFPRMALWTIGGGKWKLPRITQISHLGVYNKEIGAKSHGKGDRYWSSI